MIDADGCLLNVSVEGRDGGPTLMLSNSLGSTMQMWEPQMKALTQIFRFVRNQIRIIRIAIPSRQEGRIMVVANVGRGAVDADVPLTNGINAYGKDVWS